MEIHNILRSSHWHFLYLTINNHFGIDEIKDFGNCLTYRGGQTISCRFMSNNKACNFSLKIVAKNVENAVHTSISICTQKYLRMKFSCTVSNVLSVFSSSNAEMILAFACGRLVLSSE